MIYILAQGKGTRWSDGMRVGRKFDYPSEYKHLIPINGTPNLVRTTQILKDNEQHSYLVVAENEMVAAGNYDFPVFTLTSPGNILDGIQQLLLTSQEDDIYLLGDVIFSRKLLSSILSHTETSYSLWGRKDRNEFIGKEAGEIFALTVCQAWKPLVFEQLKYLKHLATKLWGFYNHEMYAGEFRNVDDWTDDIDSPEHYEQFYEKINEFAKADDEI